MKVTIYVLNITDTRIVEGEREVADLDEAAAIGFDWVDDLTPEAGPYSIEIHQHPEA